MHGMSGVRGLLRRGCRARRFFTGISLDDLVEFAAVEPNAAALRTVIDLDSLALTHHEANATGRAEHSGGGIHAVLHRLMRSDMTALADRGARPALTDVVRGPERFKRAIRRGSLPYFPLTLR
jgi:hypothetical protein